MKTLTIAIPTFNSDAEHILEALESLTRQTSKYGGRVEVVVVDNGSQADIAASLVGLAAQFPLVRLVRHDANLGYDRNIVRLLDSIATDFVWFFGDDDILQAFALDEMVAGIDATPDAVLVLCRASFFHDRSEVVERTESSVEPIVLEGPAFVYATAFTAAALSTFCVSTEVMRATNLEFGLDTSWVHFGALVSIASAPGARSIFIDDALVAVRRSNASRWFSNFGNQYSTGLALVSLIDDGGAFGVDRGIYEFFRGRRFATNHMDILTLAMPLSLAERRRLQREARRHFSKHPRFWLLDTPLLMTPNWFKYLSSGAIRTGGRLRRLGRIRGAAA